MWTEAGLGLAVVTTPRAFIFKRGDCHFFYDAQLLSLFKILSLLNNFCPLVLWMVQSVHFQIILSIERTLPKTQLQLTKILCKSISWSEALGIFKHHDDLSQCLWQDMWFVLSSTEVGDKLDEWCVWMLVELQRFIALKTVVQGWSRSWCGSSSPVFACTFSILLMYNEYSYKASVRKWVPRPL